MKIVISKCLSGERCLYHGYIATFAKLILEKLQKDNEIIPVCPEMEGGLPCPRPPTYSRAGVLVGGGRRDINEVFELGANKSLKKAGENIDLALLLEGSPSCDPIKGVFGKKLIRLGVNCLACKRGNGWEAKLQLILCNQAPPPRQPSFVQLNLLDQPVPQTDGD